MLQFSFLFMAHLSLFLGTSVFKIPSPVSVGFQNLWNKGCCWLYSPRFVHSQGQLLYLLDGFFASDRASSGRQRNDSYEQQRAVAFLRSASNQTEKNICYYDTVHLNTHIWDFLFQAFFVFCSLQTFHSIISCKVTSKAGLFFFCFSVKIYFSITQ